MWTYERTNLYNTGFMTAINGKQNCAQRQSNIDNRYYIGIAMSSFIDGFNIIKRQEGRDGPKTLTLAKDHNSVIKH